MELIIFRHGETDWNRESKFQGHINIPLNETGHLQAKELAKKIQYENLEAIFSSDLVRAKKTAEIVAGLSNIKIELDARLREKTFGKADGLSHQQVIDKYGLEAWKQFRDSSDSTLDFSLADGETRRHCLNRVLDVLVEIKNLNKYQKVGISTHGGVIRSLMAYGKVKKLEEIKIENCQDFRVKFSDRENLTFIDYP